MSLLRFMFLFGMLVVSLRNARAISIADRTKINEAFSPILSGCIKEFGLLEVNLLSVKEVSGVKLDPCFIGCLFKKSKMINDKGLLDTDKSAEMIKTFLSDEEDQNKALEIISTCKTVNELDVSDGEKGCERAGFLFECLVPYKESR